MSAEEKKKGGDFYYSSEEDFYLGGGSFHDSGVCKMNDLEVTTLRNCYMSNL